MLLALLLPFLAALLFILPVSRFSNLLYRGAPLVPFALFLTFLMYPTGVEPIIKSTEADEFLPFNFALQVDGLGRLFALLITGIGTLIFLYAGGYMKGYSYKMRLMGFLMLFMGAMLGVVLSDHLITLFLFWELTSISSFFLIGFKNEELASRQSALKALAVTGGGGLVMLAGFILLGEIAGTYNISQLIGQKELILGHYLFLPVLVLIFIGAFTKSAQFPFHFWLPGAMKAPTPVSAYLHSATMVKAGVYLLARLNPVFQDNQIWHYTLILTGAVTMLYAVIHAVLRTDLKSILAYSTVSALGMLVFLIGIGTENALLAASLFILIHALYKAALFLITGVIDHETGSRDISQLRGLRKVMWPLALAGILAAISNAGIPPSLGFIGKDLIYEGTLSYTPFFFWATGAAILTNIMLLVAGFLAGWKPFSGELPEKYKNVRLPEWTMWTPPLLLAILGLIFGIFPGILDRPIISGVYFSISGNYFTGHIALWHGFNTVLYLSLATIGIGGVLFLLFKPGNTWSAKYRYFEKLSPEKIWTLIAGGFEVFSRFYTQTLQNGYLRYYLLTILSFLIFFMGWKLLDSGQFILDTSTLTEITIYEAITVVIMLAAVAVTVVSRSRLAAVAAMGVIGYAICIVFVFYSAPDLAMTQFTIDTLTVILFVLVLYKLPRFLPFKFVAHHIRDIFISLALGGIMTLLTLEVLQSVPNRNISEFYTNNAYLLAKGKNVVNVILVDFRGADTLIEIVVLSIAAIGVFSLLKLRIKPDQKVE